MSIVIAILNSCLCAVHNALFVSMIYRSDDRRSMKRQFTCRRSRNVRRVFTIFLQLVCMLLRIAATQISDAVNEYRAHCPRRFQCDCTRARGCIDTHSPTRASSE